MTNIFSGLERYYNSLKRNVQLAFVIIVIIIITILWYFFFSSLQVTHSKNITKRDMVKKEYTLIKTQVDSMRQRPAVDKDAGLRKEKAQKQQQITALDRDIDNKSSRLVDPEKIMQSLQGLVNKQSGMKLVGLSNSEAQLIKATSLHPTYKFPIQMETEGTYAQIVQYLNSVEKMHLYLNWESMSYKVTQHPKARLKLKFYFLSARSKIK